MDRTTAPTGSHVRELTRLDHGSGEVRLLAHWTPGGGTAEDAAALATVDAAIEAGDLAPGGTFVAAVDGPGVVALARAAARRGLMARLVTTDTAGRERIGLARAFGADVRVDPVAATRSSAEPVPDIARRIAAEAGDATVLSFDGESRWTSRDDDMVDAVTPLLGSGETVFVPGRASALAGRLRSAGDFQIRTVGAQRSEASATTQHEAGRLSRFTTAALASDATPDVVVTDAEIVAAARHVAGAAGLLIAADGAAAVAAALRPTHAAAIASVLLLEPGHHDLDTLHDPDWLEREGLLRRGGQLSAAALFAQRHGDLPALVSLTPDSALGEAIRIMQELEVSQIPIMEEDRVVGTLRDDQIIDLLLHAPGQQHEPVRAVMDDPLPGLPGDATLDDVQAAILAGAPAVLIRLPDGRLGILTKYDLIHGLSLS